MRIEYWEHILREDLRKNPEKIFLFGDNLLGTGFGGQAKEMRGEPNAFGIPTKKAPCYYLECFFSDEEYDKNIKSIEAAFNKIPKNKIIVIPKKGIGTGLASLPKLAPKTYKFILQKINELCN